MAFLKFANAKVSHSDVTFSGWEDLHAKSGHKSKQASSKVVFKDYDPKDYLLTHCSIVASVDTEDGPGPLGKHLVDGFQVDRQFSDYYVTSNTIPWVNNNNDAFERRILLATYRTFVGSYNYVEHLQIPALSKGKIIDAAARDIGDSIYVDILVATERKHRPLIAAITSGQLQTLSMGCSVSYTTCTKCGNVALDESQLCAHIRYFKGSEFYDDFGKKRKIAELCFPAGTRITSGDGRPVAIDDLQIGDSVFTHLGRRREVTEKFERHYEGDVVTLSVVGHPYTTFKSTPGHPYYVLSPRDTCACGCGASLTTRKTFSHQEYLRSYAPGHNPTVQGIHTLKPQAFNFRDAKDIRVGDQLLLPIPTEVRQPVDVDTDRAYLLGWFLAEGSFEKVQGKHTKVCFTLNAEDEKEVATTISNLLAKCFPPETPHRRLSSTPGKSLIRQGIESLTNITDKILKALAAGEVLSSDVRGATKETISVILNRYKAKGLVSSRPLRAGERAEIRGRARSRACVWTWVGNEAPVSLLSDRQGKDHWRTHPLANETEMMPRIYLYPRLEGGEKLTVVYRNDRAAAWFLNHAGEYAGSKHLSSDAVLWPKPLQTELLRGYFHGDGSADKFGRHSVSSVSDALITQMQLVATRCGFWTRRQIIFEGKATSIEAMVANGEPLVVGYDGCRPRHELHLQPSNEATETFAFEKATSHVRGLEPKWRQHDGYLLYRVSRVGLEHFSGPVYNISVDEDESYLVNGLAVHNCGHHSDPESVKFIEASWVANPAFRGAVLRSILSQEETEKVAGLIHSGLNASGPQIDHTLVQKAASAAAFSVASAEWSRKGEGQFDFGDLGGQGGGGQGGGDSKKDDTKKDDPLEKLVGDLADNIRERALKKIREEMGKDEAKKVDNLDLNSQNESLIKSAMAYPAWRGIARSVLKIAGSPKAARQILLGLMLHRTGGWQAVEKAKLSGHEILAVSRILDLAMRKTAMAGEGRLYRTVVASRGVRSHPSETKYLDTCRQAMGRDITDHEKRFLIAKGRLFSMGL